MGKETDEEPLILYKHKEFEDRDGAKPWKKKLSFAIFATFFAVSTDSCTVLCYFESLWDRRMESQVKLDPSVQYIYLRAYLLHTSVDGGPNSWEVLL